MRYAGPDCSDGKGGGTGFTDIEGPASPKEAYRARSVIIVFLAMGGGAREVIKPRGVGDVAGRELMREGITIALDELGSEIVWLEQVAQAEPDQYGYAGPSYPRT